VQQLINETSAWDDVASRAKKLLIESKWQKPETKAFWKESERHGETPRRGTAGTKGSRETNSSTSRISFTINGFFVSPLLRELEPGMSSEQ
jgi:hypothetical protein